jgi:hypothetical protein
MPLNPDGSEALWPDATVVIGNPPSLGNKKLLGQLTDTITVDVSIMEEFFNPLDQERGWGPARLLTAKSGFESLLRSQRSYSGQKRDTDSNEVAA